MLSQDVKKRREEVIDLDTVPVKPESEGRQTESERREAVAKIRGPRGPYGPRK